MPRMTTDIRSPPLNLGLFRGDLELPGFKDLAHVSRRRRAIIFRLVALCIRAASVGGLFHLVPMSREARPAERRLIRPVSSPSINTPPHGRCLAAPEIIGWFKRVLT